MSNSITVHGQEIKYAHRPEFFKKVEEGKWEPESFDVLDKYLEEGKLFIDIGAWQGVLSIYAAKNGCIVFAIECDPVAIEELDDNLEANKIGCDVFSTEIAISDSLGSAMLGTNSSYGSSESTLLDRKGDAKGYSVTTMELPRFISRSGINIDDVCLIKIDIEGGELLLIKGALGFLSEHRPPLYIAFHPGWFPDYENDVQYIIDSLFPIYKFLSPAIKNQKEYSEEDFRVGMQNSEHSYVLISR